MQLIKVPASRESEFLQKFFDTSCFTFEGIDISDKKSNLLLEDAIREAGFTQEVLCGYWFTGSVMNKEFGLTGSNAYPDDLIFLCIPDFYNPVFKLMSGARWFDDIVANNAIKQNGINFNSEPDFDVE